MCPDTSEAFVSEDMNRAKKEMNSRTNEKLLIV